MSNLLSLLQSKDYISKIKLYCKDCTEISAKKVEKQIEHKQRIKIEDYEKR